MALTLAKLATNTASVTLHYSGEDITIEYYPARITGKMLIQMQALGSEDNSGAAQYDSFTQTVAHLIKSWTLYEDEDETVMFPLVPERLSELPTDLMSLAFTSIIGKNSPEARATQNGNGGLPR